MQSVFGDQLTPAEQSSKRGQRSARSSVCRPSSRGHQIDRSVSVSVGVVFGLSLAPLSSGIEDDSPFRLGSKPGTQHNSLRSKVTSLQGQMQKVARLFQRIQYSADRMHQKSENQISEAQVYCIRTLTELIQSMSG